MAYVNVASTVFGTNAAVDVTLDVGSTANRKAIGFYFHQQNSTAVMGTASRDPLGTPEAMTLVTSVNRTNSGDAIYMLDVFYLDLSVTGSQTFRFNTASGGLARGYGVVLVWDGLAAGAAEAVKSLTSATDASSITDAITTLTNGAVVFSGVFSRLAATGSGAPYFTPDNGQTERVDAITDNLLFACGVGDLVVPTAGAQTVGWSFNELSTAYGQVLAAFEAQSAPVGPTIDTQPANATVLLSEGSSASFTVAATGTGTLSYQWNRNATPISGATSATLNVTGIVIGDDGDTFGCNVTDDNGTTASATATLTVLNGDVLSAASADSGVDGTAVTQYTTDASAAAGVVSRVRAVSGGVTKTLAMRPGA